MMTSQRHRYSIDRSSFRTPRRCRRRQHGQRHRPEDGDRRIQVTLVDLDDEKVARGLSIIDKTLEDGVQRGSSRLPRSPRSAQRVTGTSRFDDLADVDLVVEAVFEDLEIKKSVFRRLDEVCRPDAILATNTSSYSVTELAAATTRPERVVGLHYFYHPAKNRLVEVVAGQATDPAAHRRAWRLQERSARRRSPRATRTASSSTASSCRG